jgi:hypothetical protein
MLVQPVARSPARHGLGAGLAFGPARAEVEDGLAPVADVLLHESLTASSSSAGFIRWVHQRKTRLGGG